MSEDRPTAFVAMKFNDDHWKDKTYQIIKEELESAGYFAVRADELRTSGQVVDEVCELMKEAELVVIDASGDSHSVSYEIGYCHGIGRPNTKTLLLRDDHSLPFNYRHYRSRIYKDRRHLRRLIRDYLNISEPVRDDMYGYAITFDFSESAGFGYIMDGAECIIDAILNLRFTGRMEVYSYEHFFSGERTFTVGVALRIPGKTATPGNKFWKSVLSDIESGIKRFSDRITLSTNSSEYADKRAMVQQMLFCGAAEIRSGTIIRHLDAGDGGNFIESYEERKEEQNQHNKQVESTR